MRERQRRDREGTDSKHEWENVFTEEDTEILCFVLSILPNATVECNFSQTFWQRVAQHTMWIQ